METILVTGFGDYQKEGFSIHGNPSEILVKEFHRKHSRFESIEIVPAILDANDWHASENTVVQMLSRHNPVIMLGVGMKTRGTRSMLIERLAFGPRHNLETSIPVDIILKGLPLSLVSGSRNPGTGLCNHVFFTALQTVQANSMRTRVGFFHTPIAPQTIITPKDKRFIVMDVENMLVVMRKRSQECLG